MSILEITELSHTFGDSLLYKDAALTLNKGEHLGIVGPNGAGKSTLIRICTGEQIPDEGRVVWQPRVRVGYLDQYAEIEEDLSLRRFLASAYTPLYQKEEAMNALYAQGDMASIEAAAKIQEALEKAGFYEIETRMDRVATGLGLTSLGMECPIAQMSGGQRAKVILAKLLLEAPDVLLLDEPTNFLDVEHVAWLASFLSGLDQAFMVVSHDWHFLDKITNRICDIDNQDIKKYTGSYQDFVKKKTAWRENYLRQYGAQQKKIKETEAFIRKNMAGRKSKMARGRKKQLEHMEKMTDLSSAQITPHFAFKGLHTTEAEALRVQGLTVGYDYPLLSRLNFTIKGGQKVVITGFNGIGKSTLLKTILGLLPPMGGGFTFNPTVVTGYFEQDLAWEAEDLTPVEIVSEADHRLSIKEVRRHLSRCGLLTKQANQSITTLSGGEQAKVKLSLLMLTPCNFLILDEPTNHLDVQAKEALEGAIVGFAGTVILVSHEEAFYREWADRIIDIGKSQ